MKEFSILIGGQAGFGIDKSGMVLAKLLGRLGWRGYVYRDYPSLIRGGHTFSIIRYAPDKVATHRDKIDFLLALNQETFNLHKDKLSKDSVVIYDSDAVKVDKAEIGVSYIGKPFTGIIRAEGASELMRNTCMIGAFAKAAGLPRTLLEDVLKSEFSRDTELNLKIALRGYDETSPFLNIEPLAQKQLPFLSGNQAIALGLIESGLDAYISYPMTPTSPILHYLAELAPDFGIKVIHPESEIGVILMALGFSYMGKRVAVGTSGGGFCLMTEGLSFSGMGELPLVIVVGQRPGPSTGLPTYSTQTELFFVLNAGQGEFTRLIVAPGDAEEAYFWSALAMNISWKYQIPAIILSDKNMGEGVYSFEMASLPEIKEETPSLWDRKLPYKRYQMSEAGVSPLAFAPDKDAIIKVNSYEHDEYGITIEDPAQTVLMQDKRLRKEKYLRQELEKIETVKVYGNRDSATGLLCWGSNKGVCIEVGESLGLKVIQPLVLCPFSTQQFQGALSGVKKLISVESNATGQLASMIKMHGFKVDAQVLKYDGRPFSIEELEKKIGEIVK